MLKITTAALLLLVSITTNLAAPDAESAPGAATSVTSTLSLSEANAAAVSAPTGTTSAVQALDDSAAVLASPADLITAGLCAALVGCCILGLAVLRLYRRGGPEASWVAVVRRMSPVAFSPAPMAWPARPSLIVLSISRT